MSVNVDTETARPGDDSYVEAAWKLKERIRHDEDVLKQRKGFFTDAYRRSTVYLLLSKEGGDERLMGFAAVRRDGYILFLAVSPEFRGEGVGKRLVGQVAEEHDTITCHARASNENALGFYEHLGFEVARHIDNYYEDGGDAYYLKLGKSSSLTEKLSEFMRG
ncbi:GNAT family N-acetyltransferase [Halorussus gelatinilyticus]|uniref:GNAT family N-acetyltransferase n=1 Tax=Halorussus gelatinilyticus TaxID=2937524 RepID=A0A8U0IJ62_9EURY|nr:N-acetyltransferase [Halorussus gelatinilyticus]UPW00725.1 GNAT family N-acetyltransferase [Halorussus gelatinilyticus]